MKFHCTQDIDFISFGMLQRQCSTYIVHVTYISQQAYKLYTKFYPTRVKYDIAN